MESRAIEAAFNWVSKRCLDKGRILTYRNAEFLGDTRAILVRAGRPYIGGSTGYPADVEQGFVRVVSVTSEHFEVKPMERTRS